MFINEVFDTLVHKNKVYFKTTSARVMAHVADPQPGHQPNQEPESDSSGSEDSGPDGWSARTKGLRYLNAIL